MHISQGKVQAAQQTRTWCQARLLVGDVDDQERAALVRDMQLLEDLFGAAYSAHALRDRHERDLCVASLSSTTLLQYLKYWHRYVCLY